MACPLIRATLVAISTFEAFAEQLKKEKDDCWLSLDEVGDSTQSAIKMGRAVCRVGGIRGLGEISRGHVTERVAVR